MPRLSLPLSTIQVAGWLKLFADWYQVICDWLRQIQYQL